MPPPSAAADKSVDEGSTHKSQGAEAAAERSLSGGPRRSLNRQATVPRKPLDVEKLGDGELLCHGWQQPVLRTVEPRVGVRERHVQ